MVYTVTFNPAIDHVVRVDGMKLGQVNRSSGEQMYFGGKGINVSLVLRELGVRSKALGFTAGFTGEAIENGLSAMGLETDFVRLKSGNSRINVKIKSEDETELNGQGPEIDPHSLGKLFDKLDALSDGDTLVLAGSIPASLPSDVYSRILERLSGKDVRTAVDATGRLLLDTLKYRPFLIKPNNFELGGMFGVDITDIGDIEKYAKKLREMGARNVLVSMAGDGSLLVGEDDNTYRMGVCSGTVRNSVGAGDSMLAGFIAGMLSGKGYEHALKLGTAAGGATAFSDGLAQKADIEKLFAQL